MASTARPSKMSLRRRVNQCEDSVEDVEVGKKGKSVRHQWSDNQISILIQLLKEHDDVQWRVQTGWSKEAWTKITSELNARFGTQGAKLTRDQVKEKEHGLRRKFKLFKELAEESGFGWDNEMQCVVAPPDVWEDLKDGMKKVPASLYKLKGKRFPDYDDCFDIYEGRYAEGKHSRGPKDYTFSFLFTVILPHLLGNLIYYNSTCSALIIHLLYIVIVAFITIRNIDY